MTLEECCNEFCTISRTMILSFLAILNFRKIKETVRPAFRLHISQGRDPVNKLTSISSSTFCSKHSAHTKKRFYEEKKVKNFKTAVLKT